MNASSSFAGLILALLVSVQPAQAQRSLSQQVDEVFAQWNRPGSPGAAVVVVKNGDVVYQNGYGFANLDYDIPITPTTLFDIASVSKHFTAFAVALLADRGKLSLDDDVHKYIPELPDFGQRITIRHLVHHTSGIRDWVELLSIAGYRFDDVIALPDILNFVQHQRGLNFAPGSEHLYSNTGYNLLAETVARASGQPFAQFMEEQVFRPLGMNDTHILMDHQRVM
ncbi:MAG TPA: serine hydrolase domain-containing protein, partial [Longimicrobiales bacterium]|nr:serine hydrolase domain-containing protein [Longimicrobiales bacterium]